MEAELLEADSSTGPKKSRLSRDEPPLAAGAGGAGRGGRGGGTERQQRRALIKESDT